MEITEDVLSTYKNQGSSIAVFTLLYIAIYWFFSIGGYDMLGRTIDQITTAEQVKAVLATCVALNLDGLVIIGGNK